MKTRAFAHPSMALRFYLALCAFTFVATNTLGLADAAESSPGPPAVVAPDSPRAAIAHYMELARSGRFMEASRYLQVPAGRAAEAAGLAERLKVVLDHNMWLNMDHISPKPEGSFRDGLSPDEEDVATIPGPEGVVDPVRLVRVEVDDHMRWVFSAATVAHIDAWYGRLEDRWVREHLPAGLLRPGPRELLWWQWISLPLVIMLAWVLGKVLGWITRLILAAVFKRTRAEWDDMLLLKMAGPLTLVWGVAAAYALLPWLSLYGPAEVFVHRSVRAIFYLAFFWALLRSVDVGARYLATSPWGLTHRALGAFIPLGTRIAKVVVVAMAAIATLSELGYPVASLIAGLGIGGLALALAAQKTVENLFGSVSLGIDQPIRVGDFVKVEDFLGTVESIGLRSTRIRTPDRTVVSIPNGRLADMRLETFAPRDRMRFFAIVGLVYGTSETQVRSIVGKFEQTLRNYPRVWPDVVRVSLIGFGESGLNIECLCWFEVPDKEFNALRQDVLLKLMRIVEEEGSRFAVPVRALQMPQERATEQSGLPDLAPAPEPRPQDLR